MIIHQFIKTHFILPLDYHLTDPDIFQGGVDAGVVDVVEECSDVFAEGLDDVCCVNEEQVCPQSDTSL